MRQVTLTPIGASSGRRVSLIPVSEPTLAPDDEDYSQDPLSPSPRETAGIETGARFDTAPLYGEGSASFGDKPFGETSFPQAAKGAGKALAGQSLGLLREGLKASPGGGAVWGLGDLLARRRGIPEPSTVPLAQAFGLQPKNEDEAVGAVLGEAAGFAIPVDYGAGKLARFLRGRHSGRATPQAAIPPRRVELVPVPPRQGPTSETIPGSQAPIVPRGTLGEGPVPPLPGMTENVTTPRYAYRARNVGEEGIPSAGHAQASMSEADVRRMAPSRTDAPQEVVKVNLDRMPPDDFTTYPRRGEPPWVKFNREMGEADVERVGAVTEADVIAAQKAAPGLRRAVADAGARPEEIAAKTGLSVSQAAKGVEDVRRDAMHEFSPEAVQVKRTVLETRASRAAEIQAEIEKPAIKPGDYINDITRAQAGKMIAEGDPAVIPHIRAGIAKHGAPAMQDAIRNQIPAEIVAAPKGPDRAAVRGRIASIEPEVNAVLDAGPVAGDIRPSGTLRGERGSVTLPALPVRPVPKEGVVIDVPAPSGRNRLEKVLDAIPGLRSPGELMQSERGRKVFDAIQELDQHTLPKWNAYTDKWIDDAFAPLRPSGIKRFLSADARQTYADAKERIRAALEGEIPLDSLSTKEAAAFRKMDEFRKVSAKRLGLPEDKILSDYFPHVFEGRYQVRLTAPDGGAKTIPGGFADTLREATALAEEYTAKNPGVLAQGSKVVIQEAKRAHGEGIAAFNHLLKRQANLAGWKNDPEKIWRQYGHGANRKALSDQMIKQIYPAYMRLPPAEREVADNLLRYVFGETPRIDRVVDGVVRDLGFDIAPRVVSKIAENVRTFYFVTKLGLYNAGSAAVNHTQVPTFGLAKLGPKYLAEGYKQYLAGGDKAKTLLRRSGVLLEETRAGSQIEDLAGWVKGTAEKTTAPFQIVERANRGIVYLGARQKWLDAHPGDYRGADRYGKEINTGVNFNQGKSGRQSLLRDPTAHTLLQFKNYMLKATEAFAKLNGREKAVFIASTLAIGGPTSIPFVKWLTDRDENAARVVDALNEYTNIPRMFGLSFEHDAGVGFLPSSPIELLGPAGQAAYGLGERGMRAGVGDWPRKYQVDLRRNVRPTMLARAGQFLDSAEGDWQTFDRDGRPVTRSTPGGALSNFLLGGRSKEWADRTTTQRRMAALIGRASEEKRELAIRMIKASRAGTDASGIETKINRFNAEFSDVVPPIDTAYLERLYREFEVPKMERLGARQQELLQRVAP